MAYTSYMKQIPLTLVLMASLVSANAYAFQAFTVSGIKVIGLQRVSEAAVLNDLSLQVGETLSESRSAELIRTLYKTGFFKSVDLERNGNVLIIRVVERPSVSKLTLKGVKEKDKIQKVLRDAGLAEGRMYDPALVARAQKALEHHYLTKGKYAVKIESCVVEEEPSLMHVTLDIYEGDIAKIHQISIVGNTCFTEDELFKDFHSAKTNLLSWFSNDDQYVKEKLQADLETLRSYYLDRGYIQFQIDATEVSLTPDKKHLYITIHVTEGEKYCFGEVGIEGDCVVPRETLLQSLRPIACDTTFSRRNLLEVKQALEESLGCAGYSFADIRPAHEVDECNKKVNVRFHIVPNRRVYVRRIHFIGNATTKDEVLRRELPQMEGTWVSTGLIRAGKENILRKGFGSTVEVETQEVPGLCDQVDITYKLEEARLGQIGAGIAFSQAEQLAFNFSISQENFLGTGKAVDFTFDNSRASTNYQIGYQDPYFTIDGIGMGASAYYTKNNLSKTEHVAYYSTDALGSEVRWVFPMSSKEAFKISLGYDDTHLHPPAHHCASIEVLEFIAKHGKKYQEWSTGVAWVYDTLDQRLFPTCGLMQTLAGKVIVPGSDLQYYKLSYDMAYFHPLTDSNRWIVNVSGNLGYGDGYGKTNALPFFKNFMAGGERYVRGYETNTLGPKDTPSCPTSDPRPFGGNTLVAGSVSLIFPNPIKPDTKAIRTALFFDVGQVYDTRDKRRLVNGVWVDRNPAGLRCSVGLSLTWHSPMGPLAFSLAKPLIVKKGDKKQAFSFNAGTSF
jgi:outer membrane protein insertion porin family